MSGLGLVLVLLAWAQQGAAAGAHPMRVGVYAGEGTGPSLTAVLNVLHGDPRFSVRKLSAADVRKGHLAECDVLVVPGGSGSREARALGKAGRSQIRRFIRAGGGYVGICAGAYLASSDYPWALHVLNARVVDKKHWNRGKGNVKMHLTARGRQVLGLRSETVTIHYHQGPLLGRAHVKGLPVYEAMGTFRSGVARHGARKATMKGTTAVAAARYGKGRVLCFSPHPEQTRGLHGMVGHAVVWAAGSSSPATAMEARDP